MLNLSEAREFATRLAKDAGEIMIHNYRLGMRREWKEDNSPVTVTDTVINSLVIERIQAAYPGHSILSEEESRLTDSEYTWVCDPVDGTMPFSHGIPMFCFSLALTHNGESIVGVVYDPVSDRLFTAEKGNGACMNAIPISVSRDTEISSTSLIGLDAEKDLPTLRERLRIAGSRVINIYSTVYLSMLVASGELVAEVFGKNTVWDAAAVKIIVEEAGGKVTSLTGEEQRYDRPTNGFVASNGKLHQEILDLISGPSNA